MSLRQIVPYLGAGHGLFNALLFLAFVRQGFTGWRNRRGRLAGAPMDVSLVRAHRKAGPVLLALLAAGYGAGVAAVLVEHGTLFRYPAHLALGTLLVAAAAATALIGRGIRGPASPLRTPHAVAGGATLALFVAQALLGAGILF